MKRQSMVIALIALAIGIAIGVQFNRAESPIEGRAEPAAEASPKGGQDQTGPYEVVENWPKPLSQLTQPAATCACSERNPYPG